MRLREFSLEYVTRRNTRRRVRQTFIISGSRKKRAERADGLPRSRRRRGILPPGALGRLVTRARRSLDASEIVGMSSGCVRATARSSDALQTHVVRTHAVCKHSACRSYERFRERNEIENVFSFSVNVLGETNK